MASSWKPVLFYVFPFCMVCVLFFLFLFEHFLCLYCLIIFVLIYFVYNNLNFVSFWETHLYSYFNTIYMITM